MSVVGLFTDKYMETLKTCGRCRIAMSVTQFKSNSRTNDKLQKWCKPCHKQYHLLRTFGMTPEVFEGMWLRSKGCCYICDVGLSRLDRGRTMVNVDHDHSTGVIRGLLCRNCNVMLGHAGDESRVLRRAITYLEKDHAT